MEIKKRLDFEKEEMEMNSDGEKEVVVVKESNQRKYRNKKQHAKDYNELVNVLKGLSKFDWADGSTLSQKLLGCIILFFPSKA